MLEFPPSAREDLLDIARYIARDNSQRARSFVIDLRQQCVLLSKQAGLGVAKPDLADNLRMLPYGRYLIFFRNRIRHSDRTCAAQRTQPHPSIRHPI
ncbi:MAG: type II toxin-antitoxin system RelE/ParE family toxin [Gallionellaceae bacterium]